MNRYDKATTALAIATILIFAIFTAAYAETVYLPMIQAPVPLPVSTPAQPAMRGEWACTHTNEANEYDLHFTINLHDWPAVTEPWATISHRGQVAADGTWRVDHEDVKIEWRSVSADVQHGAHAGNSFMATCWEVGE